jgi:chromosome segregation ATPase
MAEEDIKGMMASDPTPLTTAMLLREISNLSEKVGIRIDGIEKAQATFEKSLTRVPTEVQKEVGHLRELHEQRFSSVEQRQEADKKASEDALKVALQAQKELAAAQDTANAAAITKSQDATDKQVGAIKQTNDANFKSLDDKIADLKGRLDRGEGGSGAVRERNTDRRLDTGLIVAIIAILLTAASIVFAIVRHT